MALEFLVRNQRLKLFSGGPVVADSQQYLKARFTFTEDWQGLRKYAQFRRNGEVYTLNIGDNGEVEVPWETLVGQGVVQISAFATNQQDETNKLITTNPVYIKVNTSGIKETELPKAPSLGILGDYVDQSLQEITDHKNKVLVYIEQLHTEVMEAKEHIDQTDYKIYVGETEPSEEETNAMVWINPSEDDGGTDELAEAVASAQNAANSVKKYKSLWFDSVAALKTEPSLTAGAYVNTAGYYEPNDGGGASYLIRDKQDSDMDDGGSIHVLSNGLVAELIIENGTVCPEQFGAKGDGVTDDTFAVQRALNAGKQTQFNKNYVLTAPITINTILNGKDHYLFANYDDDIVRVGITGEIKNLQIVTNTTQKCISIIGGVRQKKEYLSNVRLTNTARQGEGLYIEAGNNEYIAYCNFTSVYLMDFGIGIHLKAVGSGFIQCNNFNNIVNSSKQYILEEGEETLGNVYNMSIQGNSDNVVSKTKGIINAFVIDAFGETFELERYGGFNGFCEMRGVQLSPANPYAYYQGYFNANGGYTKDAWGTKLDIFARSNKSTVLAGHFCYEDNFVGNAINNAYTLTGVTATKFGDYSHSKGRRGGHGIKIVSTSENGSLILDNTGVNVSKMPTFEMITSIPTYSNTVIEYGLKIGDAKLGFAYDFTQSSNNFPQVYFLNPITGEKEEAKNINGDNVITGNGDKHIIRFRITPTKIYIQLAREGYDKLVSLDAYEKYRQHANTTVNLEIEHNYTYEVITPFINLNKSGSSLVVEYMKLESTRIPCY